MNFLGRKIHKIPSVLNLSLFFSVGWNYDVSVFDYHFEEEWLHSYDGQRGKNGVTLPINTISSNI